MNTEQEIRGKLKNFVAINTEIAKKMYLTKQQLSPQYNLVNEEGTVSIIVLLYENQEEKEKIIDSIKTFVHSHNILYYVLIANTRLMRLDENKKVETIDDALLVFGQTISGFTETIIIPIIKDERGITFGDEIKSELGNEDKIGGSFVLWNKKQQIMGG